MNMKLQFQNLETAVELSAEKITVVEVSPRHLFSRMACSFSKYFGESALEPAVLLNDDGQIISFEKHSFVAVNVIDLDFNNKRIQNLLFEKIAELIEENESIRYEIESNNVQIIKAIEQVTLPLNGESSFQADWDVVKYCKAFGFSYDSFPEATFFDKLIMFLRIVTDLFPEKVLCFVNLKVFLTEEEYVEIADNILINKLTCILLENISDKMRVFENKLTIDEDYLEELR